MPAGMPGCVNNSQGPSGISGKLQPLVVLECPIDVNHSLQSPRRDLMRRDTDSQVLPEVIGTSDMIGMEVRKPDLSNVSAFEHTIEMFLLFFIWRRRINDDDLFIANHITIRMCCRRQRR